MNGFGGDAAHNKLIRQRAGLGAGAGKDQGAVDGFDLKQTGQCIGLVILIDQIITLFDMRGGERASFNGNRLRVAHEAVGERAYACGHGGAKEGSLAFGGRHRKDLFDLFDESHIEHFVSFIEDDGLDLAQDEDAALEQVVQTTRCANHNIHAALKAVDLRTVRLPAINSEYARVDILSIFVHGIGNLECKFAGRCKHQSLRIFLSLKVVEDGEGKGGGFACAGLGLTDHVHAGEHEGDHARLDGSRLGIAEFSDRLHDLVTQVERRKIGGHR